MKQLTTLLIAAFGSITLLLLIAFSWPLTAPPVLEAPTDILIREVGIIDVATGNLVADHDVLIREGEITEISPHRITVERRDLLEIDGSGKYLIPGLWDMHTHSNTFSPRYQHPLFVANGVLAVRDMWGCMSEPDSFIACADVRNSWRTALESHTAIPPRYFGVSSFQVNGGTEVPSGYPDRFRADTVEKARSLVAYYADAGADFIKPYARLSPEVYRALAEEAAARGMTMQGHRPLAVSLLELIAAGQRSIEHGRPFLFECFAGAADFRASRDPVAAYTPELQQRLIAEYDPELCGRLIKALAASETAWTPTLQTMRMGALADSPELRQDDRLKYIPVLFKTLFWNPDADRKANEIRAARQGNVHQRLHNLALQQVGQAHRAGATILVGTDAFDSFVYPGFSLQDEMEALVHAGLTPADTLRAATLTAAQFMGVASRFGTVEIGKAADLVMLDANPLIDINHTRAISAVFYNGHHLNRNYLDSLLAFAETQASSLGSNLRILWSALNSPLVRVQFAD